MKKSYLVFGFISVFLISCGGTETVEETVVEEVAVEEVCTYNYDPGNTVLTWTAYKHTAKAAVNGTFAEIHVEANADASDMYGVLEGANFSIPINSLNSQDEIRDPKIKASFFGEMDSTNFITGKINSINASGANVDITMNNVTKAYDGEITVDGESITFVTQIDILDFEAQNAFDVLGEACAEKHTGTDGVKKFWTEVNIAIKTQLTKTCK